MRMSPLSSRPARTDALIVAGARIAYAVGVGAVLVTTAHLATGQWHAWWPAAVGVVVAALAAGGEMVLGGASARREEKRLRRRLLETVFSTPPGPDDRPDQTARTVGLMTDNVERFAEYRQVYWSASLGALAIPVLTICYVAIAIDPLVALGMLVVAALAPLSVKGFIRAFRKTSAKSRRERARLSARYVDAIRHLVLIRMVGAGERIHRELAEAGERNRVAVMKLLAGNQIVIIVLDGVVSLFLVVDVVLLAWWRFAAGAISVTDCVTLALLTTLMIEPINQVAGFFYVGMGGRASERALTRYLAAPRPATSADVSPARGEGAIAAAHIGHDYGRGEVLRDVSFTIPEGARVAIVGPSGSGKSTLLSLLAGAMPLQRGSLRIGEVDCADAGLADVRRVSAVVAQRTWLFTGTIADNLRLANPEATDEQMMDALSRAHLADWVRSLPAGLQTHLGEQGDLMSGGQAQRLSLARAFVSGRRILLLDEPTSQVARESEAQIIAAIEGIDRDLTVVLVTHRPRLVDLADTVWRIEDGHVEVTR